MDLMAHHNGTKDHYDLESFQGFKLQKVLMEKADQKLIAVQGTFEDRENDDGSTAVIILEKTPFAAEGISRVISSDTDLKQQFRNDVYGSYDSYIPAILNRTKASVIWPATQKHIEKWTQHGVPNVGGITDRFATHEKLFFPNVT